MFSQERYPLASITLLAAVPASCVCSYFLLQSGVDWMIAIAAIMPPFVIFCWIFTTIRAAHLVGVYFWSVPSTYASVFGGLACFVFLLITAASGDDKVNRQFHAGPAIVALVCYGTLVVWTIWHNAKRTGSIPLAVSLSFVQSLALIAAIGAILSWLNAMGVRKHEREHRPASDF
jgi:hypothetical protein